MTTFIFLDEEHKNYLKEKLSFYEVIDYNLSKINDVTTPSTLLIKTNFNLNKSIIDGQLPLEDYVINVLKTNKEIKVIFFNETEPDNYDVVKYLKPILKNLELNEDRFTVINNNEELIKYKSDSKINVHVNHPHIYASAKEMIKVNYEYKKDKKYLFMSYNRNLKAHRFFFLCLLKKYNLLDNIDWSWLRGDEMSKFIEIPNWFYNQIMNDEQFKNLKNEIDFLIKNGRKISEYEYDIIKDLKTDFFDYPNHYVLNPYENSYVHIISESYYEDKDAVLLSEKSIIPLYFSQLPIFLASYKHLDYFRKKYSFDLFDDIINHDYDDEFDNYKRMEMVVKEIKRIDDNKNEIIKFCKESNHRFEKNKKLIYEIVNEFDDSKYFKNLFNG